MIILYICYISYYSEMSDSEIPSQSTSASGSSSSSSNNNTNRDPPKINFSKLPAKKELKMKDLLARSIPWDQVEIPVDVLLLTVEDCEFLACVSYLNKGFYKSHHDKPGIVYFGKIGKKGQDTLKIALMKSYMGPMNALTTVKNAVEVLSPKAVIWVGSCRGLNAKKVNLGDVVVSSKLRTYANEKVTDKGNEDWNDAVPVSTHLSRLLLDAGLGWNPPLKNVAELEVKVQNGVILSGPKEVDSRKLHAELTGRFGEAIAIDMEGEGLYKAAHDLKIEWAVIKGVADYADGTNSSTDEWKRFASFMAASVTAKVLDSSPFKNMPNYKGVVSTTPEQALKQQGQGPPRTPDGKVDKDEVRKRRLKALGRDSQTEKRVRTEEEVVPAKSK
ncbi:unnamed protein product [Porites lobata]|uniref:Nucleoside phosphorylase domain-containing protein n=1 Tax=Porites lobata TaxID=104759 RepID=A0ABN8PIA8_9CNID|nr:unnamed protein product [Porites lobata]